MNNSSIVLGSVQPSYLAWSPFFQRMLLSDVFVYLDDVEFSKNSPHNRNKIKSANGTVMLTVPVRYAGNSGCTISNMPIDNKQPWQKKHWKTIEMSYIKAPFFKDFGSILFDNIYSKEWEFLGPLNICIIETVKNYLGISTKCVTSSEMGIALKNNEKLVQMCRILGTDSFLVKPGTNDYHPKEFFESNGIDLKYFTSFIKEYQQLHGDFVPGLSIIDLVMNCSPEKSISFINS